MMVFGSVIAWSPDFDAFSRQPSELPTISLDKQQRSREKQLLPLPLRAWRLVELEAHRVRQSQLAARRNGEQSRLSLRTVALETGVSGRDVELAMTEVLADEHFDRLVLVVVDRDLALLVAETRGREGLGFGSGVGHGVALVAGVFRRAGARTSRQFRLRVFPVLHELRLGLHVRGRTEGELEVLAGSGSAQTSCAGLLRLAALVGLEDVDFTSRESEPELFGFRVLESQAHVHRELFTDAGAAIVAGHDEGALHGDVFGGEERALRDLALAERDALGHGVHLHGADGFGADAVVRHRSAREGRRGCRFQVAAAAMLAGIAARHQLDDRILEVGAGLVDDGHRAIERGHDLLLVVVEDAVAGRPGEAVGFVEQADGEFTGLLDLGVHDERGRVGEVLRQTVLQLELSEGHQQRALVVVALDGADVAEHSDEGAVEGVDAAALRFELDADLGADRLAQNVVQVLVGFLVVSGAELHLALAGDRRDAQSARLIGRRDAFEQNRIVAGLQLQQTSLLDDGLTASLIDRELDVLAAAGLDGVLGIDFLAV